MSQTTEAVDVAWGEDISEEVVGGRTFRTYVNRPRDVGSLLQFAGRWGERAHLVQGDEVVSFATFRSKVAAKSDYLRRRGVGAGDRVLLLGWNSPDWIINFWACVTTGAVPVLGNAWWSEQDVADAVARTGIKVALADARSESKLPAQLVREMWPCDSPMAPTGDVVVDRPTANEDSPAVIIFTSGTSGRPKAVVLSHRGVLAGLQMLLHITGRLPQDVDDSAGAVALHTGPMFHIGGVQTLIRAVTVGDTLVMPAGRFDAGEALRLIEQWQVARWSAVPTMVSRVIEHPEAASRDLTSLRSLTVGGAPLTPEFVAKIKAGLPSVTPRVPTGYGLTENGGQATAASGRDTTERPGTCGRPLPCVEIRMGAGQENGDGEVLVKSPTQMLEYLGDEESPIDAEGWIHTGDLGRIDDDGYLWITGRSKDLIIRGGENIAPAAVEEAIGRVEGVVESAVFGVPNSDLGEEVMAVVTVQGPVSEHDIESAVRSVLPSFAVPTRWELRPDPLPTNHSGKIDKKFLRAEATARLGLGERS